MIDFKLTRMIQTAENEERYPIRHHELSRDCPLCEKSPVVIAFNRFHTPVELVVKFLDELRALHVPFAQPGGYTQVFHTATAHTKYIVSFPHIVANYMFAAATLDPVTDYSHLTVSIMDVRALSTENVLLSEAAQWN